MSCLELDPWQHGWWHDWSLPGIGGDVGCKFWESPEVGLVGNKIGMVGKWRFNLCRSVENVNQVDVVGQENIGNCDMTSNDVVGVSESLGEGGDLVWELSRGCSGGEGGFVVWIEDSLKDLVSDVTDDSDDLMDLGLFLSRVTSEIGSELSGDVPWNGSGLSQDESIVLNEWKIWVGGVQGGLLLSPSLWAFWVPLGGVGSGEVGGESNELSKSFDSPVSNSEWHLAIFYLYK